MAQDLLFGWVLIAILVFGWVLIAILVFGWVLSPILVFGFDFCLWVLAVGTRPPVWVGADSHFGFHF